MSRSMNDAEVCSKEDQMLTNDGNIEDQFNPRCRQEDASAEMTASQDMNEESTELFENKVIFAASLNSIYFSRLVSSLTSSL